MYSTTNPGSVKPNKWLAKAPEKEPVLEQKELGAILSYNSPLSPIRPYPTQFNGIDK